MTSMPIRDALCTRHLCASLGHGRQARPVLQDVNLALKAGCWTSIVGPNGAGKSTLLRALAGLLPVQGEIWLLEQPLRSWAHKDRARSLAWLAQGGATEIGADDLTVYDVAMLGRLPHQGWLAPPGPEDHAAVERSLRQTGAWEWRDRPLGALSGGERQRVLLARLLAVEAGILLMDEPLANLDPPHQADWIALVRELVGQGRTVVSVLHEISVSLMADELVVMRAGQVRYTGRSGEAAAHEALADVFDHRLAFHRIEDRWVALPR
ncbi:MAG TPA: ABC transporter ATP-binding protein [Hydrogenophaga sp.]|nr:ABC transporter ATP-binding protein [Hydrogenophaga sp.]HMP11782.1 ABC transporter ATP-binding protein [Hydrogenophaga sp.]